MKLDQSPGYYDTRARLRAVRVTRSQFPSQASIESGNCHPWIQSRRASNCSAGGP